MEDEIILLKEEHVKIKEMLNEVGQFVSGGNSVDYKKFGYSFKRLNEIWGNHEKKESVLIKNYSKIKNDLVSEKTLFEMHRQLRGYWNSIKRALEMKDCEKLAMALDTDGRMLLEKFEYCINFEENFFDKILE